MATNQEANNEELLQMAIRAAKSGQKDGARMMFRQVYDRNRRNETALMWLAKLSKDKKERREWMERILEINPDNAAAQKAIKQIVYKKQASDNRTLVLFGGLAVVMFVVVIVIFLIALAS